MADKQEKQVADYGAALSAAVIIAVAVLVFLTYMAIPVRYRKDDRGGQQTERNKNEQRGPRETAPGPAAPRASELKGGALARSDIIAKFEEFEYKFSQKNPDDGRENMTGTRDGDYIKLIGEETKLVDIKLRIKLDSAKLPDQTSEVKTLASLVTEGYGVWAAARLDEVYGSWGLGSSFSYAEIIEDNVYRVLLEKDGDDAYMSFDIRPRDGVEYIRRFEEK